MVVGSNCPILREVDGDTESSNLVYVPRQPGPLISTSALAQRSDEIDDVLDDVFGRDDDSGPSATDAILVATGAGAIGVGQLADLAPAVTIVGVGLIGLGAILPIRSGFRRMKNRNHRSRTAAVIGDGIPLRQDDPILARIAHLHDQVSERSKRLVPDVQLRFVSVAHSLIEEVATLLKGELPVGRAEVEYVKAREEALMELAATAADPRIGDGDPVRRRAATEARIEIEQAAGGSALTDSAELRNDLLPPGPDA